jgi:hypothetical protein
VYRILVSASSRLQDYPSLNYANFMSGRPYITSPVRVLIDKPLPWIAFLVLVSLTVALITCAACITEQQDF